MAENPTILFHTYGVELCKHPDGTLVLDVLCGKILEFGVDFELNAQERIAYQQQGDAYLLTLAAQVRRDWRPYVARTRGEEM